MKVTSFPISEKLAKIGFKADFDYCYKKDDPSQLWNKSLEITCWEDEKIENYYPAFDFQTIFKTLPQFIIFESKHFSIKIVLNEAGAFFSYQNYHNGQYKHIENIILHEGLDNLADGIGKFVIILHEKGLINFNGETNAN